MVQGTELSVLSVYLRAHNHTVLLWQWSENNGDIWNEAQVTVPVVDSTFTLIFEGSSQFVNFSVVLHIASKIVSLLNR